MVQEIKPNSSHEYYQKLKNASIRKFWIIAVIGLILDLLSKFLSTTYLVQGTPYTVIENILDFNLARNYGAAFSLGSDYGFFLTTGTAVIIAVILYHFYAMLRDKQFLHVSLGLVVGGAIGNFIDRVRLGYVVDFIDFHFWPIFNIADILLVIGVSLYIIKTFKHENAKEKGATK